MRIQVPLAAAVAALCSLVTVASAAPERPSDPTPQPLADGVWWLRGEFVPGRQPDGNSVLLRGEDGLVVVDTGRHPAHAQRLLDFAAAQQQPIAAVVNSHWHLDHVGGNPLLRIAHPALRVHATNAIEGALQGFLARSRAQLVTLRAGEGDAVKRAEFDAEIARIDAGAALRPDVVVDTAGAHTLAGRPLQIGVATANVTAGDLWLFDPASRVLVAGDLVTLPAPFLDTACAPRWQATLSELDAVAFETLVPGHGAPMSRAQFATYRNAFDGLLACAASDASPAACVEGWLRDAGPLLDGHPEGLTRGLVDYYVTQRLRGDAARADCPHL
jgi:glyoxylase-like metal-dependent hydrolase (beta-lactamase superfamily II)